MFKIFSVSRCHSTCHTCLNDSAQACTSCVTPYYFFQSQCLSQCPVSYFYPDDPTRSCLNCHSSCYQCIGNSQSNCSKCFSGYFLQFGVCVEVCMQGYYGDTATQNCLPCSLGCRSCVGTSQTQCTTCLSGYYLIDSQSCVTQCPQIGYYLDELQQACITCNQNCKTCQGPSRFECLTCYQGTMFWIGECLEHCPSRSYQNLTLSACVACSSNCDACDYFGCLSCNKKFFMTDDRLCNATCLGSYYGNREIMKCVACHSTCLTCNGDSEQNCLTCSAPRYLLQQDDCHFTCVTPCPQNYYGLILQSGKRVCEKCHSSCLTCEGPNGNSCYFNFILAFICQFVCKYISITYIYLLILFFYYKQIILIRQSVSDLPTVLVLPQQNLPHKLSCQLLPKPNRDDVRQLFHWMLEMH